MIECQGNYMQSLIITAKDITKRQEYVQDFCKQHTISDFDTTILTTEESSFGIAEVRNLQSSLYIKPVKGEEKVLVIEDAQKITPEAQNALLKILEEPPSYVTIILSATESKTFLPTVISRCKVIQLTNKIPTFQVGNIDDLLVLKNGTVGDKLALAEKLAAKKDELPQWFESVILSLHSQLLQKPEESREVAKMLGSLQSSYTTFQNTNVNPRLLLEHTFLSFLENSKHVY